MQFAIALGLKEWPLRKFLLEAASAGDPPTAGLPDVVVQAFPQDDNCWRIDWFGEVAFPNRLLRRQQPSVLVHLSLVSSKDFQANPKQLISAQSTAAAVFQIKRWVSVGTMVLLRVGDIWRHQRPYFAPDYQLETFQLDIDDQNSSIVKAGLSLQEGFLLPLNRHPWHRHNTQAYCLAATLEGDRRLVVPCMELIRFYFGSSSSLLSSLFLPTLTKESLVSDSKYDPARRHLRLKLAEGIRAASAADIGRMLTEPLAWRAAMQIGSSCLKASVQAQAIHPQVRFPFQGQTVITAAGKWLPLGDRPDATFVVFNLRQCERPFQFRSLEYQESTYRRPWKTSAGISERPPEGTRRRSGAGDAATQPLVERDAASHLQPRQRSVPMGQKFPDLANKRIWGAKKVERADGAAVAGKSGVEPVQTCAVGDPGSSQRIRPVDLTQMMKIDARPATPKFLSVAVEALTKTQDLEIQLLTASEHDGWTVPIDLSSDEDGVIDPALLLQLPNDATRLRQMAAFTVLKQQRSGVLVLVENEPFVALFYSAQEVEQLEAPWELTGNIASQFVALLRFVPDENGKSLEPFFLATIKVCTEEFQAWLCQALERTDSCSAAHSTGSRIDFEPQLST